MKHIIFASLLCSILGLLNLQGAPLPDSMLDASRFLPTDGKTDAAPALQKLIDENPNRTIYIPDGTYLLASPVLTPAHPKRSVSLHLANYAILKAAPGWNHSEAMIRLGAKDPANDILTPGSNYGLTGGIIDGSDVATAISIDGGRETTISHLSVKNAFIGIHIKRGANNASSDADIFQVNLVGNAKPGSIGVLIQGYDNTLTNMRIANFITGVDIRKAGANTLRNIHPLYSFRKAKIEDFPNSVGFRVDGLDNILDFCYSDQFATGFLLEKGCRSRFVNCVTYWYSPQIGDHTAVAVKGEFNAVFRGLRVGFRKKETGNNHVLTVEKPGGKGLIQDLTVNEKLCNSDLHRTYLK